jgi:hypothetical protein
MGSNVADAKFLRRVFLGLIGLTIFTGGMAALAVANAMNSPLATCMFNCQ